MKGIDIFCASQSATAISLTMDQPSSSSSSSTTLHGGGSRSPAIDRCNPIITDSRRTAKAPPPLIPKPHRNRLKKNNKQTPHKENGDQAKKHDSDKEIENRISSGGGGGGGGGRKSWSCTKPGDFISPPGSTRYLLSEKVLVNAFSDGDLKMNESFDEKPPSSSPTPNQVVVLRVSLHCRGCERKMRKHISRMEGVTSFDIDFAAKKVTVTGNITPLEVISSISKVKNAQLWSPTISSSSSSTPSPIDIQSNSGLKNHELKGENNNAWVMDHKGAFVGLAFT